MVNWIRRFKYIRQSTPFSETSAAVFHVSTPLCAHHLLRCSHNATHRSWLIAHCLLRGSLIFRSHLQVQNWQGSLTTLNDGRNFLTNLGNNLCQKYLRIIILSQKMSGGRGKSPLCSMSGKCSQPLKEVVPL